MQALQWFQSALSRALRMPLTSSSNTHATCNHCFLRADPHKFFFVGSRRSSYWKIIQAQLFVVYIIMPNRGRPTTRKSARTRQGPAAAAQMPEQTNFRSMATEPLRLLLAQHNLTQTGTRQQLIARLEANQEVPNPQSGSDVSLNRTVQDSNLAPQAELAQLIASIIDEKLASRQDGGHPQTPRGTTCATPREGHAVEPSPTPLQDGCQQLQDGRQQQQSLPTPQSAFPALPQPGALFNASNPVTVAALLPDFRQPSIASHLTKTTTTAITNGQYVDFATLLPISSLLEDALNSQLKRKVGEQGLTIPLPSASKRPKITTINKWLDAFAIFSSVLVASYPSCATALIAYQQLIRDTARKFPGMSWYVYDVEFRRRASHNLSLNWGERDVQLYLDTFTGLQTSGCRSCSSSDHHADSCPLSTPRSRSAPPSLTCASTLTMADPVPAPHALSSIDATNLDAMQLTQARNTQNSPATEKTALSHLQALVVPPGATPEYLSQLSPPTPINIPKLAFYLHDHPNQPFVQYLLSSFSHGFKIGYSGPRAPQEFPNLPSAKENPSIIDKNMLKEVSLGHTAGPFLSPPFPNFQVYPIGAIPKKHSSDWRTIFHLSYPKHRPTSVNAHIPPEDYSLQYIKVDNAITILQDLGQNCFMSKLDIKAAFRNIPIHPTDWELLGMKWQGLYFFDLVLPFGLRSAPLPF